MSWKDKRGKWQGTPAYLGGDSRPSGRPAAPVRKKPLKTLTWRTLSRRAESIDRARAERTRS
jgi:hypothetical protein